MTGEQEAVTQHQAGEKPSYLYGVLMAMTTAVMWGVLPIILKVALQVVDPMTLIWIRFLIAAVVVYCALAYYKRAPLNFLLRPPKLVILAGIFLSANYFGYMLGLHLSGPANAQIVIQSAVVLFIIAGVFVFKERLSPLQLIGFAILLIGYAIYYTEKKAISSDPPLYDTANLWILFAGVTWCGYAILQKKLTVNYSAQHLNLVLYAIGTIVFLPFIEPLQLLTLNFTYGILVFLAGLNTAIAYGALAEAFRSLPVAVVSVIIAINPLITLVLMHILTEMEVSWIEPEPIPILGYLGALIVICGVLMVVYRRNTAKANL